MIKSENTCREREENRFGGKTGSHFTDTIIWIIQGLVNSNNEIKQFLLRGVFGEDEELNNSSEVDQ